MYQYKGEHDTIAAIATPLGSGGLGIIRISGQDAVGCAGAIFQSKSGRTLKELASHQVHYGWIVNGRESGENQSIDEVLVTLMKAPRSYTREDVVEISSHGGIAVLKTILKLVLDQGVRLAEPGEFTKRAFLNGRIDLAQAEAVLDMINAKTENFLKVCTHQLKGDLSRELNSIRGEIMTAYTEIEAVLNFPEDDIDSEGRAGLASQMGAVQDRLKDILSASEHGRLLREGMSIVLCGRPNVGKSSLLNVLLKVPRAIVSEVAGTTRDTLEESAQIRGIPFQLVDTAGILEPRDLIEKEAVERSHRFMNQADLVLLVLENHSPLSEPDMKLMKSLDKQHVLVVVNKSDLSPRIETKEIQAILPEKKIVSCSTKTRKGIDALEEAIVEDVWHGKNVSCDGILVSNIRHIRALEAALKCITRSGENLNKQTSLEVISDDFKRAVNELDGITGRNIDQDLLDTIFSRFCIGK